MIRPLYQPGTRCPCCGNASWLVGRQSAECARCQMVLPLASGHGVRDAGR